MWSPNIFSTRTGLFRVDCETKKWQSSMVAKFNWFGKPSQQRSQIFKFKDWPPQSLFRTKFPELHKPIIKSVPYPDLVRPDGV